jgi:flagellar hook-length control protein FliK
MELVASLPPDFAAIADPTARAAAPPLRPTDQDDAAAAAAMPFEWLLGLLTTPLPGGEGLPAAGNGLPAGAVDAACDSTAASSAFAKSVTPPALAGATGADLLARLKLSAAPAVSDQNSAQPGQSADAATANAAQPFVDLDLPTPDDIATKPAAAASASAAAAPSAPGPDVAAALEAALPQTAALDPSSKSQRASQVRGAEAAASASAAAAPSDLRAEQASAMEAPTPIAEIVDAAARPVHREVTPDTFALSATAPSVDAAAPPTSTTPALAPMQPHVATAAASPADATALAGHGAAIDTRADNWHEALASRVQVLVDQHVGEAHIKLNPPELGAVDNKISLVDDKTFVQLTAGSSAARDELTQSLPRLRELLSASGLSFGGASVHGGSAGQSGYQPAPRVAVPAYAPFAVADDSELAPVRAAARAAGRIDLFA